MLKLKKQLLENIGAKEIGINPANKRVSIVYDAKPDEEYTAKEFREKFLKPLADEQNNILAAELEAADKRREDAAKKAAEHVAAKKAKFERIKTKPFVDPHSIAGQREQLDTQPKAKGKTVVAKNRAPARVVPQPVPVPVTDFVISSADQKPVGPQFDKFGKEILD